MTLLHLSVSAALRNGHILIVDDDEDAAKGVAEILEERGYTVAVALTSTSAEETARVFAPEIALIDVRLGRTSGLDLVSVLKQRHPSLICIMITGYADKESAVAALRRGAYDYLSKPIHAEELFAALDRCFDKLHLEQENVEAVQALRVAKEEAEHASKAKSSFLARMSHELRTPLNAVIGFSEILMNELSGPLGNPSYKDYAKDINESGLLLLSLISDILDMSKIEAGKYELNESYVDVTAAIQSSLRLLRKLAIEGRVELTTSMRRDLPDLWVDERAIKQIILNLLSNAIKFTPPGGTVTIGAELDHDGSYMLSVVDTGIGIAKEDIPRALDAFSQVNGSYKNRQPGTGLGLPLVSSLVGLHDGSFDLESTPDIGTKVFVRFPTERVLLT